MFEKIRDSIKEVIEIADKCPEKYQIKCFEVLLESVLREEPKKEETYGVSQETKKTVATFFSQNNISQEEWENVYHLDGSEYKIIVKDLKDRAVAKKQIKIGVLLGIKSLLETNEAIITKESLVDTCKTYSAYDPKNFALHMRRNKNLFLTKGSGWVLTVPGKLEAAKVIKELA